MSELLSTSRAEEKRLLALLARLDQDKSGARQKIEDLETKSSRLEAAKRARDRLLAQRLKEIEDLEKRLGKLTRENTALEEHVRSKTTAGTSAEAGARQLQARVDALLAKLRQ